MKTIIKLYTLCMLLWSIGLYAQCTTGTTSFHNDGKMYGCVEGKWIKLSEDIVANFNQGGENGRTARHGDYIYAQENGKTYQLPNLGQAPISIAGREHVIGKMIYANGHFYQGVANGLWHQVDNIEGTAQVWDRTHYIGSFNHNGINIDGTIANTGEAAITLQIPYNQAMAGTSYQDITINRTIQDRFGSSETLTLHIPAGRFTKPKGFLTATIKVGNGTTDTYKVKQLPANTEEEITNFTFSMNGRVSTVKLIATGGLLDRNWDKQTDGAYKHKFVYLPISVYTAEFAVPPLGKPYEHTWLNNNLGVEYANANNPNGHFNPTQQAKSLDDHLAFGSLFQWQRPADGHELVEWTSSTTAKLTPITYILSNNTNWTAEHSNYIFSSFDDDHSWVNLSINRSPSNKNLWNFNGANNPCPLGYHVPTNTENEQATGTLSNNNYEESMLPHLRLPTTRVRFTTFHDAENFAMTKSWYWTSSSWSNRMSYAMSLRGGFLNQGTSRTSALPIRCIKTMN